MNIQKNIKKIFFWIFLYIIISLLCFIFILFARYDDIINYLFRTSLKKYNENNDENDE